MSKHTPGPWRAVTHLKNGDGTESIMRDWTTRVAIGPEGSKLGLVGVLGGFGTSKEQNVANAHLIAASPDLLSALERLADYAHRNLRENIDSELKLALINAGAALDKARGVK